MTAGASNFNESEESVSYLAAEVPRALFASSLLASSLRLQRAIRAIISRLMLVVDLLICIRSARLDLDILKASAEALLR